MALTDGIGEIGTDALLKGLLEQLLSGGTGSLGPIEDPAPTK